ncbi:MAG: hypothetical protein ACKOBK_05945, partial [Acidimicrobiaceae bacterium]
MPLIPKQAVGAKIIGWGTALPEKIVTNDDLSKIVDTTDEWIVERSGIRSRHIAGDDELTSDLGIAAARQALVRAGFRMLLTAEDDIEV